MFWTVSGGDILLEMHAHIAENCLKTEWIANLVIRKAVYRVVPGVLVGKKDALVIKAQCLQCRLLLESCQLCLVSWEIEIPCSLFCMGLGKKGKKKFLFHDGIFFPHCQLSLIKFLPIVFKLFLPLSSIMTSPSEQVVWFWKPSERRASHSANFCLFLSPFYINQTLSWLVNAAQGNS